MLAGAAFAAASPAPAQRVRYESVAAWTGPYVEHLIRSGVLRDPDPLTRPLQRAQLARALQVADTAEAGAAIRATVRMLAAEFDEPPDTVRWTADAHVGALAASDARHWALRPSADSAGLYPQLGLRLSVELPHLAFVAHPEVDNRMRYDPDYRGKKDRFVAGRSNEAYLLGSWRYADAFLGIVARNWGPPDAEGMLLAPGPYPIDHLFVRLGPRRLRLELMVLGLDPVVPWDSTLPVARYAGLHRLVVQPSDRLAFSLGEAVVYATRDAPRSAELWYLNPLNLFLLAAYDGAPESNAILAADAAWRVALRTTLFGQLLVDDIQVDNDAQSDREPAAFGVTLGASGGLRRGRVSWAATYTRVANLTYRTPRREEQYTIRDAGVGRNFSDYDQATLRLWTLPLSRLLASVEATVLRQGEGDIRQRYPPLSAWDTLPTTLTGTVERTVRLAVGVSWTPVPWLTAGADLGYNGTSDAGHVAGASDSRFVWRLRLEARRRVGGSAPAWAR